VIRVLGSKGILASLNSYVKNDVITTRPFHPRVNEAQAIVDTSFNGYLTGQFSLDDALKRGQQQIKTLS